MKGRPPPILIQHWVQGKNVASCRVITFFNPFSAEQQYIVVSNTYGKYWRRYIVAYAMTSYYSHREKTLSQDKFIKRYKWLDFSAEALREMLHKFKKLFNLYLYFAIIDTETVYTPMP